MTFSAISIRNGERSIFRDSDSDNTVFDSEIEIMESILITFESSKQILSPVGYEVIITNDDNGCSVSFNREQLDFLFEFSEVLTKEIWKV